MAIYQLQTPTAAHVRSHVTPPGHLPVSQQGPESLLILAWEPFWEFWGVCQYLNSSHIIISILFKYYLLNRDICEDPPVHTNTPIRFHSAHLTIPTARSCKCHHTLARPVPRPSCQGQHKTLLPRLLWTAWQYHQSLLNTIKRKDH